MAKIRNWYKHTAKKKKKNGKNDFVKKKKKKQTQKDVSWNENLNLNIIWILI